MDLGGLWSAIRNVRIKKLGLEGHKNLEGVQGCAISSHESIKAKHLHHELDLLRTAAPPSQYNPLGYFQ